MALKFAVVAMFPPVFGTVTLPVAVAVLPPGTYCTTTVQVPPVAGIDVTDVPHVPPAAMENAPPTVPTLAAVGVPVMVSGPFAPE